MPQRLDRPDDLLALGAKPAARERAAFNRTIHGARGVFACIVLLFHVVNSGLPTWPVLTLGPVDFVLRTSAYGVELFFCISGFVIVGTLRRATGPWSFMEDRFIRIYPVLWITVLVIVVLGAISENHGFGALATHPMEWLQTMAWLLPANLLGLPGVIHWLNIHPAAWSLSYELFFYGFCAVAWFCRRQRGLRSTLLMMTPIAIALIVLRPRGMLFLPGVALALGLGRWRPIARLGHHPIPFLLAFLLLWQAIQSLSPGEAFNQMTLTEWAGDVRLPLALAAVVAVTIGFAGIAAESGVAGRLLRLPVMQFLGTISYSFYLWHPIVMSLVKWAMRAEGLVEAVGPASQLVFLLLSLPVSIVVAWASQLVLERRTGLWLRQRLHHRPSVSLAASS